MSKKSALFFSPTFFIFVITIFVFSDKVIWSQEPPSAGQDEIRIVLGKTSINRPNNTYVFYLEGETNLPEETVLEGEVYYAKKIPLHESLQKEIGQKYQIEYYLMDKRLVNVKNSRFELICGFFKRPLYSGDYNFKIKFDPNVQPETIRQQVPVGLKPIIQETTVTFGNPVNLPQEKLTAQRAAYQDLEKIQQFYQNLVQTVQKHRSAQSFDSNQWNQWSEAWQTEVNQLLDKNKLRFEERIYWLESSARYSISLLGNELLRMAQEFARITPGRDLLQSAEIFTNASKEFLAVLNDQLQSLGYQKIVDQPKTAEILAEIKSHYNGIKASYQKYLVNHSDLSLWATGQLLRRTQIKEKLFSLTQETPDYIFAGYILPLGEDVTEYFKLIDLQLINNDRLLQPQIEELQKRIDGYFKGIAENLELLVLPKTGKDD